MSDPLTEDRECTEKGIPSHLHAIDRPVDNDFNDLTELLFRRYPLKGGDVTQTIVFKRMSVNRGKYCLNGAEDCLWDSEHGGRFSGFGVAQFPVNSLNEIWAHLRDFIEISLPKDRKGQRMPIEL